ADITCTTADMYIQRLFDGRLQIFFFDGISLQLIDKYCRPCHKAGRAITALKGKMIHKGLLYRAKCLDFTLFITFGMALDGNDFTPIEHVRPVDTGAGLFLAAVFLYLDDCACMANALPTTKAGAGKV